MKERSILMSAPMVLSTLRDDKTNTRRIVRPSPDWEYPEQRSLASDEGFQIAGHSGIWSEGGDAETEVRKCPYGVVGDRLWVREAWRTAPNCDSYKPSELEHRWLGEPLVRYEADGVTRGELREVSAWGRYRHARFMPRWASRLTLKITDICVQRLQEISEEDAIAEGIEHHISTDGKPFAFKDYGEEGFRYSDPIPSFGSLWKSINGPDSWNENPWVWVITFKRLKTKL